MGIDKMRAIHSKDMEQYLKSLGVLDNVKAGKYKCEFCNNQITISGISCIYPENKQVKFCCNNAQCYEAIIKKRAGKGA